MVNLQAEIQEFRVMRAKSHRDENEDIHENNERSKQSHHTGLMHLSSVAEAAQSLLTVPRDQIIGGEPSILVDNERFDNGPLPNGWKKIIHDSGLPCYVNESLQIVTWSKPYPVICDSRTNFLTVVKTHVPALSIFHRRGALPRSLLRPNGVIDVPTHAVVSELIQINEYMNICISYFYIGSRTIKET